MEHETEIQASKLSKVGNNGKIDTSKIGKEERNRSSSSATAIAIAAAGMGEVGGGGNRLRDWQHSSRIIRVSRASGGKDRHSKVWTAKGPRDRRVRLSVATAIQFYDLQDRLGVDQPSKAVEWLIKVASDAISELPSLNSSFDIESETPTQNQNQISNGNGDGDDEQVFDSSAELEGFVQAKSSACSSASETSKGSGRTEIRAKARERARERTAKDNKDRDKPAESTLQQQQQQHSSSFTQLLTSGIGNMNNPGVSSSSSPMSNNYLSTTTVPTGIMSARGANTQIIQLGGNHMMHHHNHQSMMTVSPFSLGGDHELQHFPFVPDHHLIVPASTGAGGSSGGGGGDHHYNLNFSISPSSALAAYNNNNRGTLQSNSLPSLLPHFQRFPSSSMDGSTLPFFLGAPIENPHQHQHQHHNAGQFPSGLQLCYGDNGGGVSDQKGKGKN